LSKINVTVKGNWSNSSIKFPIEGTDEQIASEVFAILTVGVPIKTSSNKLRYYPTHRIDYVEIEEVSSGSTATASGEQSPKSEGAVDNVE